MAAGGGFVRPAWRRAWAALLLAAAAVTVWLSTIFRDTGAETRWFLATLTLLIWVAANGALWRLVLAKEGGGPRGLQFGRLELRLLAVRLLAAVFLSILSLLFFVVVLGFAYAAAASGNGFVASDVATWASAVDSRGRALVSVVVLAAAAVMIWAGVRISLAQAATAASDRIRMLETWPLTRGLVWRLLVSHLLIVAWPAALLIASARLAHSSALGEQGVWILAGLDGLTVAGLWLPLSVGVAAYFYRAAAATP